MSTELRCACTQRVGYRHVQAGFDYTAAFYNLTTGHEITHCPCCRLPLGELLVRGDLRDVEA